MADFQFNLRELWILLTDRTPPVIWAEVRRQFPANDVTQGRNLFAICSQLVENLTMALVGYVRVPYAKPSIGAPIWAWSAGG